MLLDLIGSDRLMTSGTSNAPRKTGAIKPVYNRCDKLTFTTLDDNREPLDHEILPDCTLKERTLGRDKLTMNSGKVSGRQLVTSPPIVLASFDKLQPTRSDSFCLFYDDDAEHFRFKLTVVDRSILPTTKLSYATAVFLIPAGRESEYTFASSRGLESIAESAQCARLVAGK